MYKKITAVFIILLISITPAAASESKIEPRDPSDSLIILFVTASCASCARAKVFLDTLDEEYILDDGMTTSIDKRIISVDESDGVVIANRFFEAYNVPQADRHTPILFYTGGYMVGDQVIAQNLEMLIRSGALRNFEEYEAKTDMSISLPLIFGAGLLGGVNPCSISMVLLLLSLLASRRDRIIPAGLSYITGKLFTYLFLGLLLYNSFHALETDAFRIALNAANWAAVALAVGLCVLNLMDYLSARHERYGNIRVQLPKKLRALNNELIKKSVNGDTRFIIPLVFILGVIVSAGEFLCTGQIYLATILYVLRSGDVSAVPAFLAYVIAMVIPMTILLILCAGGRRLLELSEFARKNLPLIKLANAVLFLAFAVYMVWTYFSAA